MTQTVHATVLVPPKGTHGSRVLAATPADAVAATTTTAIVPWSTGSHNSAAVERARALAARQLARQRKPLTKADLLQCLWFVTQAANLASLHANVSQTCTVEEIRMMLRAMLWDPRIAAAEARHTRYTEVYTPSSSCSHTLTVRHADKKGGRCAIPSQPHSVLHVQYSAAHTLA